MFDLMILFLFLLTLYAVLSQTVRSVVSIFNHSKIKYVYEPKSYLSGGFRLNRQDSTVSFSRISFHTHDLTWVSEDPWLFTKMDLIDRSYIKAVRSLAHEFKEKNACCHRRFLFHHVTVRYLLYPPDV